MKAVPVLLCLLARAGLGAAAAPSGDASIYPPTYAPSYAPTPAPASAPSPEPTTNPDCAALAPITAAHCDGLTIGAIGALERCDAVGHVVRALQYVEAAHP